MILLEKAGSWIILSGEWNTHLFRCDPQRLLIFDLAS
jgi:hypothetical protein